MTGLGTDLLALSCILFGTVTSGSLTLALIDGQEQETANCAVRTASVVPGIVVTGSRNGGTVLMTRPDVAVELGDCETVVRSVVTVDVDEIRRSVERVRVNVERAQTEVEEARVRVEEARAEVEESRAREEAARIREIRLRLEAPGGAGKGGAF